MLSWRIVPINKFIEEIPHNLGTQKRSSQIGYQESHAHFFIPLYLLFKHDQKYKHTKRNLITQKDLLDSLKNLIKSFAYLKMSSNAKHFVDNV